MDLTLHIAGSPAPYVAGEENREVSSLCEAIEVCLHAWGDDPAYRNAAQKLREVQRELEVLCASPGRRAAMRSLPPMHSGQEPSEEGEYGY